MTDRNSSSSKEISMTKVTDLIERLKDDSSDFVYHERHEAAAELLRLSSECEALREALAWLRSHKSIHAGGVSVPGSALKAIADCIERRATLQETNGGGDVDAPKGLDDG